jgi:hypothetical protein
MSSKDTEWGGQVEVFDFDHIPVGRDIFLIGAEQLEQLHESWLEIQVQENAPALSETLNFRWCAVQEIVADTCRVNVCIDLSTRYHGALHLLPRAKFVACVRFWNYEKRPYLIVDQEWFDQIQSEMYSLYALVDAIGVKAALDLANGITSAGVVSLKTIIDGIAMEHPEAAFFTFADTVLIKTNWSAKAGEYDSSYYPEQFLAIVEKVRAAFQTALRLPAYAVVTQGANFFQQPKTFEMSSNGNHIFIGSLGTPFANLQEIEAAVRRAIREGAHPPKELYLAEWFVLTLHFKHYTDVEDLRVKTAAEFATKVGTVGRAMYFALNAAELFPRLRNADVGSTASR